MKALKKIKHVIGFVFLSLVILPTVFSAPEIFTGQKNVALAQGTDSEFSVSFTDEGQSTSGSDWYSPGWESEGVGDTNPAGENWYNPNWGNGENAANAEATAGTGSNNVNTIPSEAEDKGFDCGFTNPKGCIAAISYTLLVQVPHLIFMAAGIVFDTMMALSLSSSLIKSADFVNVGWVICRDIANTFFIFILLYIAIMTILGLAGGQTKRMLATLVMVALLMNFSLYVTRFVIDIGNVFALEFYTKIGQDGGGYVQIEGDIQARNIASGFAGVFDLQKLEGREMAQDKLTASIFLYFMTGVMLLVASFVFLVAGFLFLSRIVIFWLCMIASPLAFFSWILPNLKGKIWGPWSQNLISATFSAPIFLFFIYLILQLSNSMLGNLFKVKVTQNGIVGEIFTDIITTFLQFFVVIALLLYALKTAKNSSGVVGESFSKIGGTVVGAGVIGGGAILGRKFVGGGAQYLQQKYGDKLDASGRIGQYTNLALGKTAASSFDLRASKTLGQVTSKVPGLELGSAGGAGGYAGKADKRQAQIKSRFEDLLKRDPVMAGQYLASQRKSIGTLTFGSVDRLTGIASKGVRVNPDEYTAGIWKNLNTKQRLDLIDRMPEGKDKEYLKNLNVDLTKGVEGRGAVMTESQQKDEAKAVRERTVENSLKTITGEKKKADGTTYSAQEKYEALRGIEDKTAQEDIYKKLTARQRAEIEEGEKLHIEKAQEESAKTGAPAPMAILSDIEGRLSREDRERILEQKQKSIKIQKEAEETAKIDEKKRQLSTATAEEARTLISELKPKDIARIDANTLTREEVAQHIGSEALTKSISEGGLTESQINEIVGHIIKNRASVEQKTLEALSKGKINHLTDEVQKKFIEAEINSRLGGNTQRSGSSPIIIPPGSKTV